MNANLAMMIIAAVFLNALPLAGGLVLLYITKHSLVCRFKRRYSERLSIWLGWIIAYIVFIGFIFIVGHYLYSAYERISPKGFGGTEAAFWGRMTGIGLGLWIASKYRNRIEANCVD